MGEGTRRIVGTLLLSGTSAVIPGCLTPVPGAWTYDSNAVTNTSTDAFGNKPAGSRVIPEGDVDERFIGKVVELDDRSIDDFIKSGNRVVLFYYPASGGQALNFDKAAKEVDSANFGRANAYFYKGLIPKFRTGDLPSIILYRDGREIDRLVPSFFDVLNGSVYGSYKEIRNKVKNTFP